MILTERIDFLMLPEDGDEGLWLSATAIFSRVRKAGGSALRSASLLKFSRALANIPGMQRRRSKKGTEYWVKPQG